jgi:hypothetical protein
MVGMSLVRTGAGTTATAFEAANWSTRNFFLGRIGLRPILFPLGEEGLPRPVLPLLSLQLDLLLGSRGATFPRRLAADATVSPRAREVLAATTGAGLAGY